MNVSATGLPRKPLSDSCCPNWFVSVKSDAGGRLLTFPASRISLVADFRPGTPYLAAANPPTMSRAMSGMIHRAQRIHDGREPGGASPFWLRADAFALRLETAMGRAQEPC